MSKLRQSSQAINVQTVVVVLGVPFRANGKSWQFIPPKLVIGLAGAFLVHRSEPLTNNILVGLPYGILLNIMLVLHIIGHIISSKFVVPAMTEARITPTLIQTRYDDDFDLLAPKVHIIRSLGGPLMNLLLGVIAYFFWMVTEHHVALFLVGANWLFMIGVLLPFPTVDGEVIWREIGRMWRQTHVR